MNNTIESMKPGRVFKWLYIISLLALFFSGFGQMPVFNRYYVTSIPGLSWSGEFYITLVIHYLAVSLLLGLLAYNVVFLIKKGEFWPPVSRQSLVRGLLFLLMIISGIILIGRNLKWFTLPPDLIIAATLAHIGGAMLFMIMAATYFRFGRAKNK